MSEEKNLTDEEIAKAILQSIEYSKTITYFDEWGNCKAIMVTDILDLIYRLQDENERLKDEKEEILPNGINKWTIDRIDTNGNYEPSNCRWITIKEQSRNTRKNRVIEFNGEKHTIAEWTEILNLPYSRIYNRLADGWSVERAFTTPVNEKHINKKYREKYNG